jgi:uncharacterized protein (TIGR02145 family)
MKKFTITLFLVVSILKTQAQDYLISFDGTGDTNVVSTVRVDNLTSGATVTLNGGDILHLKASLGIEKEDIENVALQVYPNPMKEQSILTFVAPGNGNAVISLVDLSGKTVYQTTLLLSSGVHSFRVFGVRQGMYFAKVAGKNYNYSAKLISQSNLKNESGIEYVSSEYNATGSQLKIASATIDMPYATGDLLHYKGTSGQYGTVITDVPTSNKTITFNFALCKDFDGNNYEIVQIGTQTWMAENLKVGVRIDGIQEQTNNTIIEKYCHDDNVNNCIIYGGLYQWDEMMQYITTEGVQGICPTGWHLPTDTEWTTLIDFLGGVWVAGGKMKVIGAIESGTGLWRAPNAGATNESGFSALPGANRNSDGTFSLLGYSGYWWCSTELGTNIAGVMLMNYENSSAGLIPISVIHYGYSVRCIRNF